MAYSKNRFTICSIFGNLEKSSPNQWTICSILCKSSPLIHQVVLLEQFEVHRIWQPYIPQCGIQLQRCLFANWNLQLARNDLVVVTKTEVDGFQSYHLSPTQRKHPVILVINSLNHAFTHISWIEYTFRNSYQSLHCKSIIGQTTSCWWWVAVQE